MITCTFRSCPPSFGSFHRQGPGSLPESASGATSIPSTIRTTTSPSHRKSKDLKIRIFAAQLHRGWGSTTKKSESKWVVGPPAWYPQTTVTTHLHLLRPWDSLVPSRQAVSPAPPKPFSPAWPLSSPGKTCPHLPSSPKPRPIFSPSFNFPRELFSVTAPNHRLRRTVNRPIFYSSDDCVITRTGCHLASEEIRCLNHFESPSNFASLTRYQFFVAVFGLSCRRWHLAILAVIRVVANRPSRQSPSRCCAVAFDAGASNGCKLCPRRLPLKLCCTRRSSGD